MHVKGLNCLRMYYLGLIQADPEYAFNCYVGNLSACNLERLVKLSKSSIRAAFGVRPWHSSAPLFAKLNILPLEARLYIKTVIFTFRCINSLASAELSGLFTLRSSLLAGCRTRGMQDNSLFLPDVSSAAGTHALSFFAADRWNMLPSDIRLCTLPAVIRRKLSEFLGHPVRGR